MNDLMDFLSLVSRVEYGPARFGVAIATLLFGIGCLAVAQSILWSSRKTEAEEDGVFCFYRRREGHVCGTGQACDFRKISHTASPGEWSGAPITLTIFGLIGFALTAGLALPVCISAIGLAK